MVKKEIKIPENVSNYVEKCWFEWEGIQKILAYITKSNACTEHLDYYTKIAIEKNYVLEKAKAETVKDYIKLSPEVKFEYEFDFDNSSIWYWEV